MNRPFKILHVITRLDMGGSSQNTLLTCRELAPRYETVLVHGLTGESRMTPDEQVAVERLKAAAASRGTRFIPMPALVRRVHPVLDLAALWGLWRHVRRERPDIVHTHTSKAGIVGRLAARLAGVPHVVHTPHGHVFYGHFGRIGSRLFLALERRFARMTDRLVALTGGERRDYLELGVGAAADIRLVHSGVEFDGGENGEDARGDSDARRRALGLDPARRAVGFVGWLLPVKGPHHLLNAMRAVWPQHPDTDLVFVGRGDLEGPLKAQAAFTGHADHVRFLGWRADVRETLPLFDLLVLPSLNEGMGRVLLEAMAAGRPVVASRVGGIPDLVRHEENGLLVPPGDEQALAAGIVRLLQDRALARRLGDGGRASCREFGVDAMAARLDRMYRELLAPETAVMDGPIPAGLHRGPAAMRNGCWPTG